MPELPEVEVVRAGLAEHLLGATFEDVRVLHPRATRGQDTPLELLLPGARVEGVARRGKYLWFELSDSASLLVHLGMSGQMLLGRHGEWDSPHLRILADMGHCELAFVDQRTFGRWLYTPLIEVDGEQLPTPVAEIARDPLNPEFDFHASARRVRASRSPIKSVLLNQKVVSGIGNIYADEALWAAGIKPQRRASALRQKDAVRLLEAAAEVMKKALAAGGTSFDSLYVNVNGASGYFSRSLNAYGREGLPCPRCETPISRTVIQNRSAHFCSHCQTL